MNRAGSVVVHESVTPARAPHQPVLHVMGWVGAFGRIAHMDRAHGSRTWTAVRRRPCCQRS